MKLLYSPRSPFVRKIMIALHETKLLEEVELIEELVALHLDPNPAVIALNPLGKIPVLVSRNDEPIYDSRVICEYLNDCAGGVLYTHDDEIRRKHLRWQALADGLTDILLLWRTELSRETGPWPAVTDGWLTKVRASLSELEASTTAMEETPFGIGHIAVICALGQLDFRWRDCAWREAHPNLATLEAVWAKRPSVVMTQVPEEYRMEGAELTAKQLTFQTII